MDVCAATDAIQKVASRASRRAIVAKDCREYIQVEVVDERAHANGEDLMILAVAKVLGLGGTVDPIPTPNDTL